MTRRTFQSPRRLPPSADPARWAAPTEPLPRVLVAGAWRAHAFAGSLGHGLRRTPTGRMRERLVARISAALRLGEALLAAAPDEPAARTLVEARLAGEPWPWIESWAEACIADVLVGTVAAEAFAALSDSSCAPLARIAAEADGTQGAPGADGTRGAFGAEELAAMPLADGDGTCLQLLVDRWMPHALRLLGPPGGPNEPEALRLRIKSVPAATSLERVLPVLRERLEPLGLVVPRADSMGLSLPGSTP